MTVGPLADLSLEQRARCNFFLVLTKWATLHRQGLWDSGPLRFFRGYNIRHNILTSGFLLVK